jgi:ribonucleoside-triphosphate reductase
MDSAVEVFKIKRKWMKKVQDANRMPFITQTPKDPTTGEKGQMAVDLDALVYTIGVLGINEMVQAMTGVQMHESKDAYKMAIRVMTEIEMYANQLSQENNMEIALARTPAETTCQRFAVSDLLHDDYREKAAKYIQGNVPRALEMIKKTRDLPVYYTNGTHVPPAANINLFDRMDIEHTFFPIVDGGNIFHIWLGEAAPDPQD